MDGASFASTDAASAASSRDPCVLVEKGLRCGACFLSGPKPMVQHFQRDGLKLVIAAIGIEQIVRHHGIQVGAREGQSDAVKNQQGQPSGHGQPWFSWGRAATP